MAIFSFIMKTISRSGGRSSVAAVAYAQALTMKNPRDGLVHNYCGKQKNVLFSINQGRGFSFAADELWPLVELHHKRKDAVLAREIIVALPHELDRKTNIHLLRRLVNELCDTHGVAVSAALHAPSPGGDERNFHAHLIYTSVAVSRADGQLALGKKVLELDAVAMQRSKRPIPADVWRRRWQDLLNETLVANGVIGQVDCRSLAAQRAEALARNDDECAERLNRLPDVHLGPVATAYERRTGRKSVRRTLREVQQKAYANSAIVLKNIRSSIEALVLVFLADLRDYRSLIVKNKGPETYLINLGKKAVGNGLGYEYKDSLNDR